MLDLISLIIHQRQPMIKCVASDKSHKQPWSSSYPLLFSCTMPLLFVTFHCLPEDVTGILGGIHPSIYQRRPAIKYVQSSKIAQMTLIVK